MEKKYLEIERRINSVKKNQNQIDFGSSIFIGLSSIVVIFIISSLIEYNANGDEAFRKFLYFTTIGAAIGSFAVLNFKTFAQYFLDKFNPTFEEISLKIGNHFPELKDRLLNAIQLKKNIENQGGSRDLSNAAFTEIDDSSKSKNFNEVLDKSKLKRSILVFSLIGALGLSGLTLSPLKESLERIINHKQSYLPPIPFTLKLIENQDKIKRGTDFEIGVLAEGSDFPETINLFLKEASQENYDSFILRQDSTGNYKFSIKSLKTELSFFAKGNFLTQTTFSDTSSVKVFDIPFVKDLFGNVIFPRYTGISPQILDNNNADITALKGSSANFKLKSNRILDSAFVEFTEAKDISDSSLAIITRIKLKIENDSALGGFRINKSGNYQFKIYSDGLENEDPIKYRVLALEDDSPKISLVQPTSDVQLNSKAILPIKASISDDYGLGKLFLHYKLTFSKYVDPDPDFQKIEISYNQKGNSIEVPYVWDLNELGISPEDKFEFYLEVFDNDIISGPKSAKTNILKLRLPSLDEAFEESEIAQKEIQKEMDEVLKESEKLNEKIEELKNELRKDAKQKELSWQQKKESKDVFEKREQLKEKMEDISKKLEQTSKQMQDNQMLSKETLEKYQKLQDLMKEVSTSEMKKQSEKLNEQMNQMTPEQMQKALEQTQLNDEQFRQQIERSMKMLKKIQAEQKMDEIAKKAKEMQDEQKAIEDALNKENISKKEQDKLLNKQKALEDKLNDIENEMKELANMIKETGDEEAAKDFEKAVNDLNPEKTKEDIQDAQKQMQESFEQQNQSKNQESQQSSSQQQESQQQQSKKQAQQKQKNVQKRMNEFSQQMSKMKQEMMQKAMQKMINDMKKSISDIIELSKQQEELKENTQQLSHNSNQLPKIQNKQGDISQSLNNVGKKLMKLSEQSFEITPEMAQELTKAMKSMGQSASELSERRPQQSGQKQQQSMTSLNKAATQMQDGLEKMMSQANQQGQQSGQSPGQQNPGGDGKGQSPGGSMPMPSFGQQLQNAAAQQQLLKQSLQQMMQEGQQQGEGQVKEGQGQQDPRDKRTGQNGRLQQQMGDAQKSLEQLAEEQKKSSSKDGGKIENELRKISKEMKELMSDIESGKIDGSTLEKQERILSRLLDAQRSVNERDFQKKREAKSGKDYKADSPNEIDWESRQRKKQMEEMLKLLEEGYSKDYELIIKKYFEQLKDAEGVE